MTATPQVTADEINRRVAEAFPGSTGGGCVEIGPTWAVANRPIDAAAARPGGFVPGPTQFALADAVLWYLTFAVVDRVELMALTSDLDITFLRPAHGQVLWARAEVLSAGRRKVVGAVTIWCDARSDPPSAVAKGTYVLPS